MYNKLPAIKTQIDTNTDTDTDTNTEAQRERKADKAMGDQNHKKKNKIVKIYI